MLLKGAPVNANVSPALLRIDVPSPACPEVPMQYDPELRTIWAYMDATGVPAFSLSLMRQIREQDRLLEKDPGNILLKNQSLPVDFYVGGSKTPGIYSLGGDLALFIELIKLRDEEALRRYAARCNDCLWARINNFGSKNLVTISLIQGTAFGGGWESALASDFIIAERGTKFMFPEYKFNLYPGMGAFTILTRKLGSADAAMQMIMSDYCFSAEELYEKGLVNVLAEPGQGEVVTRQWIKDQQRLKTAVRGILRAKAITERYTHTAITREELDAIGDAWSATALQLTDGDIRVMSRFLKRQQRNLREMRGANRAGAIHETSDHGIVDPTAAEQVATGTELLKVA
jgi:DSF synthase